MLLLLTCIVLLLMALVTAQLRGANAHAALADSGLIEPMSVAAAKVINAYVIFTFWNVIGARQDSCRLRHAAFRLLHS